MEHDSLLLDVPHCIVLMPRHEGYTRILAPSLQYASASLLLPMSEASPVGLDDPGKSFEASFHYACILPHVLLYSMSWHAVMLPDPVIKSIAKICLEHR